ncbi:MAP7 domain-containing protein [Jiangella endophytica]|uniref:MAP7 domain-containing protein n=1 Tax=Jiangella endophytica TaxID=1623398 RepID=UPI000E352982|nr:MAP7 domain-containing protein [Jiangella endophytica]
MSLVAGAVSIVAEACQVPGGDGLGDQFINPTGNCELSAFHVQLSLAGGITDPFHLIFKVLMSITWAIYQFQVIALAWVTDFVLGMTWLDWFTGIAGDFQDSIAGMLSNLNMYVAMLTISAFVCVLWMARGMWGKGLVQLLLSLIIANYAVAAISYNGEHPDNNLAPINPITWLIGDNDAQDGLLYDARDTSQYLVGQIVNDDDYLDDLTNPENQQVSPGESILSTFLYHPAMLVNFGYILDGDCEEAYVVALSHAGNSTSKDDLRGDLEDRDLAGRGSAADGVDTGSELTDPGTWWGGTGDEPVDYDPEVWKVVGSCLNDEVDTFAKMARPDSWMAQFAIQPAVTILAVLILIIAGVVFIAGLSALVQCVKLLVTLLLAILPGGARSVLWRNIGQLFATVLMLMFCIVFLGVFLHVVTDIMASGRAPTGNADDRTIRWAEIGKFLLIDLLLIAGIVLFWRGRGAVHETKDRVAAAMASRFNSGGGGGGGGGFGGSSLMPTGGGPGGAMRRMGSLNTMSDAARNMSGQPPGQGRLQGVIRRTSGLVGNVGMVWATGGGSLAVKGGAMAAKTTAVRSVGHATRNAVANGASRTVEFARRHRVQHHLRRGNDAAVNRVNTLRRRSEIARADRADQARLRKLDNKTRRAERIARMTRGRYGAERVNSAPEQRRRLLEQMKRDRRRLNLEHRAQNRAERKTLTPDEARAANERDRRYQQQKKWQQIRDDQLREQRKERRRKKGKSL